MRPAFFGLTLPAGNTKPWRHSGGSARLSICLVGQRDPSRKLALLLTLSVGSKWLCSGIELRVRLLCSVIYRRDSFMESSPCTAALAKQSDTRATCFCNFLAAWMCTAVSARLKLGLDEQYSRRNINIQLEVDKRLEKECNECCNFPSG
ncbi:hypothetical protein ILYODFUR_000111 [Ilyodon furcidens]|uniref:Uncharacterized protein n=1 Tax=Ilyodon furcidens TaxID=33524 RepID=A0ABV0UC42_9TELE